jgi:hypothetical protein
LQVALPEWSKGKRKQKYMKDLLMPYDDPDLPHVPRAEWLIEWFTGAPKIKDTSGKVLQFPPGLLDWMLEATFLSWVPKTCEMYGSGVIGYVEFMLENRVLKESWLPMTDSIMRAWIAARIGRVGRSAMNNAICAMHAWEAING